MLALRLRQGPDHQGQQFSDDDGVTPGASMSVGFALVAKTEHYIRKAVSQAQTSLAGQQKRVFLWLTHKR